MRWKPDPELHPNFIAQLLKIAEDGSAAIAGPDAANIRAHIERCDMVFALWPDKERTQGIGLLCLKGQQWLMAIMAAGKVSGGEMLAIPCRDADQAQALLLAMGEVDDRYRLTGQTYDELAASELG
jgi:hypothetical protein